MALCEYFPNYIWNLSVAMAPESGGIADWFAETLGGITG